MNLDQLFDQLPVLDTERLRLRAITPDDWQGIDAIYSDAEVGRYNCWTGTCGEAEARQKIEAFHEAYTNRQRARWGICLKESDALIGDCAFVVFDHRSDRAEIGYNIARAHWQKGYMTEALRAMIECGFDTVGMNRIEALVQAENAASRQLLKKLGFTEEGTIREGGRVNGVYTDMLLISVLKSEYLR